MKATSRPVPRPATDDGVRPFAEALARHFARVEVGTRYRVAVAVLSMFALASATYGVLAQRNGSFHSPVEAVLAAIVAVTTAIGAVLLLRRPRLLTAVGPAILVVLVGVVSLNISEILRLSRGEGALSGELFVVATWLPALYVWSFVVAGPRWALAVNGAFLATVAGVGAVHLHGSLATPSAATDMEALLQLLAAGVLYNVLLTWIVWMYRRATGRVRELASQTVRTIDPVTGLHTLSGLHGAAGPTDVRAHVAVISILVGDQASVQGRFGHAAADRLVAMAGQRLRNVAPDASKVGRVGDTELLVVVHDVRSERSGLELARRFAHALRRPYDLDGDLVSVAATAGVACSSASGESVTELARRASEASDHARTHRNATVELYRPEFSATNARAATVRGNLEVADLDEEFEVHFQPIVDLVSGRVTAFESLLRWTSPVLGPVRPAEFIPAAEAGGRIHQLGSWVLRRTLEQLSAWHDSGLPLHASVNVSPVEFLDDDYVARLRKVLEPFPSVVPFLTLELTEGVVMHGNDEIRERLAAVRALGPRLAIDDFGSGFSSLAYLRELPVQSLKIDRAFLRDVPGEGIAHASAARLLQGIVELGRALDLVTVTEGVETAEQAIFVRRIGSDTMQGFFASRPVPAAEATRWPSCRSMPCSQPTVPGRRCLPTRTARPSAPADEPVTAGRGSGSTKARVELGPHRDALAPLDPVHVALGEGDGDALGIEALLHAACQNQASGEEIGRRRPVAQQQVDRAVAERFHSHHRSRIGEHPRLRLSDLPQDVQSGPDVVAVADADRKVGASAGRLRVVADLLAPHRAIGNVHWHAVEADEPGDEEAEVLDHARGARDVDRIADLERPQGQQQHPCGHVRERSLESQPDRQAGGPEQGDDAGRLDAETVQDGNQREREHGPASQAAEDGYDGRVEMAAAAGSPTHDGADPAGKGPTDDEDDGRSDEVEAEPDRAGAERVDAGHGGPPLKPATARPRHGSSWGTVTRRGRSDRGLRRRRWVSG